MNMAYTASTDDTTALSPRRQRARARRTERIVGSAMDLIAAEGFDALTMTRLADELDLSVGALYRYFRSKDALVAELQGRAIATIRGQLVALRADLAQALCVGTSPRVASCTELLAIADHYLLMREREPRLYRLVAATLSDPRHLVDDAEAAAVAPSFTAALGEVASSFDAAVASGALEEGSALRRTVAYWTALHGVSLVGKLERLAPAAAGDELLGARRLGRDLAATMLRGWGADPDDLGAARAWLNDHPEASQPTTEETA
ncbi:MAG TPA: TetR/AcrR family transcriptional regulator [Polyangiaceae bacterium]|nr:TetR/AcrR family transcriptional regulator [Polyangiaceae bacterium]